MNFICKNIFHLLNFVKHRKFFNLTGEQRTNSCVKKYSFKFLTSLAVIIYDVSWTNFLNTLALPEAPSNCEIDNELLSCEPGHDGGLAQKFLLEALEVRPRESAVDNEISTLNDQVSAACRAWSRIYEN